MSDDSWLMILIMVALIALSALFSAMETAFSSLSRNRIKTLAEDGNTAAQRVMTLSENYDRLLSTILVGNNVVNIALASLGTVFFVKHFPDMGATISTIVITVAVLIFGEVTPKNLAKEHADSFAMSTAGLLQALVIIFTPVNALFSLWRRLLHRIFKTASDPVVTEEEVLTLVEEAVDDGEIDAQEQALVKSAIDFNEKLAVDILTPRVDVVGVDKNDSREVIEATFSQTSFSRLPVYDDTLDHIIGVLHIADFFDPKNSDLPIDAVTQPPVFVPETGKIGDILKLMQRVKSHIAIVTDAFGGTMGIVTMEDILEELVGEIWDEHDEVVEDISQISERQYRVLGSADLDDLFEYFGLEEDSDAPTVGGWVLEQTGKIPVEGDRFTYENLQVEVSKMEKNRVMEITVAVSEPVPMEKE